jgi:diacylglycerol kinase
MIKNRIRSFTYAFRGLQFLIKTQWNAKIHLIFAILAIVCGVLFQITSLEWAIIFLCIGSVLSLEAVNTAIEQIVDLVSPEYHELAKNAKDVAAGAVLIAAMIAILVGTLIFIPYVKMAFFSTT